MTDNLQMFGGSWTEEKLEKVRRYLVAYNTALKNTPFTRMYIDVFAGTGYRTSKTDPSSQRDIFGVPEVSLLAKGSARAALEVEPAFDRYIFIKKNRNRLAELKLSVAKYPDKSNFVTFVRADANQAIRDICKNTDWQRTRAVMFLDPYGMQVDWCSIELVAQTQAIDLWYLFASGIGVNRLLTRTGQIVPSWQLKLDRMLGTKSWREVFYASSNEMDLFPELPSKFQKIYDDALAERFILNRLRGIFAGVADSALPLRNSSEHCMYHLVFACGNKAGARIALRIAEHILTN